MRCRRPDGRSASLRRLPTPLPVCSTPELSAAFSAWLGADGGLLRAAAASLTAPWVLVAALTVLTLGMLGALTHWLSLAG